MYRRFNEIESDGGVWVDDEIRELDEDEDCPCGSGLVYGACCKPKRITWKTGYGKHYMDKNVVLPDAVLDTIERSKDKFYELFGRYPEGGDKLIYDASIHSNEYFYKTMKIMRAAGFPEDYLYAFYRTDGLMPNEFTVDNITTGDLQEFDRFRREYRERICAQTFGSTCNVMQYVLVVNEALESYIDDSLQALITGFNYFINRISGDCSKISCVPASLEEYMVFVAVRTVKTLASIQNLIEVRESSSIYALGRGLFECYVYLRAINSNKEYFDDELKPIMLSNGYGFEIDGNNVINYQKINLPVQKPKDLKTEPFKSLERRCGSSEDHEMYDLFYTAACQFVHVDALVARSYFYESDLYEELRPDFIACICSISCAVMVLHQLALSRVLDEKIQSDLLHLAKQQAERSAEIFELVLSDPLQLEEEYVVFVKRMRAISRHFQSIGFINSLKHF